LLIFETRNSKLAKDAAATQRSRVLIFEFRFSNFGNRQWKIGNFMNIRIYITSWCPDCHQAERFLEEHQLPYEEIDIETDLRAARFVKRANNGKRKVPTFDVDGRIFSCSPFSAQNLKEELGL
jgi:glutaredoxin